ncbi:LPD38 domain-containing protein [Petrimonas sp.]|uniref:LPD38 domain-containing protein n=1 Tax=Petrimonas sp. TaxID=2023866 RepID=UPI002FCB1090
MPIFEYNGKKYNVPDDKVEGFKSRKPEATLVNSAPFYLADDKTVKNPQSANTVDPVQDDITNAAQRQDGFWATGVGDAIEKLGAGTLNTVGGIAKVLQETPTGKLVKKFSDYATEKTGVKPLIENNDVAGYLSKEGQKLSEKGDFHGKIVDEETGQVRKKTYRDLWKEGNKLGALGEVMLTATESAPTSALAMMPGGLALVSASAAGQKYSEINSNPETKDLPEWKKWLNASVSGVIEGATEKLGAKVDLKMIEPFLKKMTETTVKGILKKGGVNALIQTISEGAEEVFSQLGTNVVDYATGVSDEYKPFEGVQDSFVYGAGGGAQFGGVTGSAAVYRASTYAKDRHNANKVVKDADQQAGEMFDGWDEVKSQLSGMSAEERTETLRDVLKRDNISIPAKKAFTDYVSGITYKESLTGAAEAKAVQDAEAGKETGQRLYDTLKDKRSIALSSLNIEKQELEAQLGDLASLPLTEIEESPEATPDIINAARKYNIVKSEFDGVMDRLRSEVDVYVQPQIESLEQVAKDGTITELNIGSTENPETVYLLSGDISFNEDGTVNREASLSPTINVKGSDGKKRQIGTHHVVSGKVDDLEQAKEAVRQIAYDKYVNPLADKMEGKRHFELNETVEFVDDKGKAVAGKVNGKQGQAVQVLHSDGKTTSTFTESELDQRLIGETLGDVQIRDKFPVNIDGETLDAEVQDISDGKATLYVPNHPIARQRYMDVSLDELNQMRAMPVSGPQEIDKTLENTPQNEGIATEPVQQNETETAKTVAESQITAEQEQQAQQTIGYSTLTDVQLEDISELVHITLTSDGLRNVTESKDWSRRYKDVRGIDNRVSGLYQEPDTGLWYYVDFKTSGRGGDNTTVWFRFKPSNKILNAAIEVAEGKPKIDVLHDTIKEESRTAKTPKQEAQITPEQQAEAESEERRANDLNRFFVKDIPIKKLNTEGDHPLLIGDDAELAEYWIENKINRGVESGKSVDEISMSITSQYAFDILEIATIKEFIKDKIAGATSQTFAEFRRDTSKNVNDKYDAELAALDKIETEKQAEIERQQFLASLPKTKDGEIDYQQIEDDDTFLKALQSEFGDEAHNVVDEYKKAAEKALKGISKINDPIRKRREQARRQAELDRWNVMFEATRPKQQAPTYEEVYNPILTKNSRERESQMGDYVSLRDFLLRNIGTGKLRFMWNSRDGRKGLKDEILSSKNTNAERLRRIAFLDNNGFTPESLAEFINDNHGQDIPEFSTLDVQDVRNEINDVLLSFDTPTDMIEAAERLRRDDMSLESYTEQNVSPEEIANYEANDVSQNELLLTLPEQETPEISEQELIEYYGNERGIEDIEQYPDTERGVYRGTEKRDQISLQAASDGVEAAEERQTGEQGARDSFAEPDQERAEQAIAGYDNQEDGASGTERKYSAGQRISIDSVDHEISEAGTYVGTNDHFYTLEKDGQPVYEDISEQELDNLINNVAQSGNIINFVENKQDEPNETNEVSQPVSQGINGAMSEGTGRVGQEPNAFQRGFETSIRDAQENKRDETELGDGRAVESSPERRMVERKQKEAAISRTIEAANDRGNTSAVRTVEEREELESRGINPDWDRQQFLSNLKSEAQKNGVWFDNSFLDDKTLIHDQKQAGTSENDVYVNPGGKKLTKLNNLSYVLGAERAHNLTAFIDRIKAHNTLFPETAYTIIGFMQNKNGFPSIVLEQAYVDNATGNATQEEINKFLTDKGFELSAPRSWSNEHEVWSNGIYELFDARPANVLKGNEGQLYFIDTFPHSVEYMSQQPVSEQIDDEAAKVDTNPTDAQKEAGNYKKGHVNVNGFDITIENPKGSERSGTDPSGRKWTRTLKSHYGYFKRTKGKDGDQIDVFIGENPESRFIFVVDQLNQDGTFDEHKVMLGYDSFDRAKEAYLENYEEGWQGLGAMTVVEMEDFRKWLDSDSKRIKPFSEYKQIQETIHETEKAEQPSGAGPIEIDVEGLFGALRTKGEAKLPDHVKPQEDEKPQGKEAKDSIRKLGTGSNVYFDSNGIRVNDYQNGKVLMNVDSREDFGGPAFWNIEFDTPEEAVKIANELAKIYPNGVPQAVLLDRVVKDMQSKGAEVKPKPAYGANNKIITQDRYNELREQMRKKLNNLNVGFDPEVFSIGAQMAMYHIESGAHKFADFAKRMVDDLGDAIRPYLKASYEGARAMPGMEELSKTMDPYKEVQAFDVNHAFEEQQEGPQGKQFTFKQESPMAYGKAMKIMEKRYRYPDGKVMTRYEWIESLPHGLEVRTVKVAAKNDEGYREELWLNQTTITKTEQDYYEYLQQGGMTISDHLAEEEKKAIEDEKKLIEERKAKEEERRKQNEIAQAKQDQNRKDTIVSALQSTRDEFINIGTKSERDYVESFNNRRRKDSAYERDLAVANNNLEARRGSAGRFYDMAKAIYILNKAGNPVRKYNYKVGDKVVVTAWANPVETVIQEVKGEGENAMYVVEKRDGIHNQHVHYDSIRPAEKVTITKEQKPQSTKEQQPSPEPGKGIDTDIKPKKGDKIAFEIGGREVKFEYDSFISDKNGTLTYDYFGMKTLKPGEYRIERGGNVINVKQENGSNTKLASTEEREVSEKIEDFVEKIEGAKFTKEQYESFDTRGYTYAVVKDGKVVTRGSNPILAKEPMPIKSLLDIADNLNGDLYIAPTSGQPINTSSTDDLIIGGLTWQQVLDKQQGKSINLAIELKMPNNAVLYPKYEELYPEGQSTQKAKDTVEEDKKRKEQEEAPERSDEYRYELTSRPFSIGTQPDSGFVRHEKGERFGSVIYNRKLTREERTNFSLIPITEYEDLVEKDYSFLNGKAKGHIISYDNGNFKIETTNSKGEKTTKEYAALYILEKIEDGSYKLTGEPQIKYSGNQTGLFGNKTVEKTEKIEDFGEKIEGAKKDTWRKNTSTSDDIKSQPLSKSFPRPDFAKLVDDGSISVDGALILKYLYDGIPSKPRKKYKLSAWTSRVQEVIDVMNDFIDSPENVNAYMDKVNRMPGYFKDQISLYFQVQKLLGFPKEDVNIGKYEIKKFAGRDGYSIVKSPYIIGDYKTIDEAVNSLKNKIKADRASISKDEVKLSLYQDSGTKKYFIGKKGATGIVRLMDNIETIEEARTIFKEQQPQLQEMWRALKINPEERRAGNRDRIGTDYRKGKDINPEEFSETFGFRGVQFGNWVNNDERQSSLNEAYDALMDLSTAIGVSTRAISLNGELGLAFGARGSGKANAHYEPGQIVINLTKTKGAGSLAHEWWHAIDNYFSRMRGEKSAFITEKPRQGRTGTGQMDERVRKEMIDSFKNLVTTINKSELPKRSGELDKTRSKAYWSTIVEMSARSFENFIIEKMAQTNESNDYLANFKELSEWAGQGGLDAKSYPYPTKEESELINSAYQQFFDTIQEKVDEEAGNTILFRKVDESGFYSTVEDALEQIKQEKGTPEQFKAMLLKNGAKQAELDWMDYDGTFTGKSVTKTEIQDWIDQNRIEVEEVQKGGFEWKGNDLIVEGEVVANLIHNEDGTWSYQSDFSEGEEAWETKLDAQKEAEEAIIGDAYSPNATKFSQYVLPGGKNYRELLLTMPQKERYSLVEKGYYWWIYDSTIKTTVGSGFETRYEADEHLKDYYGDASVGVPFQSGHFEESNILAHVRFDEREVDGERVLFIEEIQSDWAQEGKKKGFKSDNRKAITESLRKEKDNFYTKLNESEDKQVEYGLSQFESGKINREQLDKILLANGYSEYDLKSAAETNAVPDMPFKKTDQWVNLALRRMMMYAAENDYDRIAWTTGEQQADRYDLSKQVDKVLVSRYKDGYALKVLLPDRAFNNDQTLIGENLTEAQLEERIGKDLTQKVISDNLPLGQTNVYEGLDLKVGGEGMKAFYDQIVPNAAKKLSKPFGANIETVNIQEIGQQQSIPITDALREIAPNGMPLFRKRDTEAREAYAMREWNRAKKAIDELAAKMGVSVEIIETTDGLPKAKAEAKGWYDTKSKKIAIVMPNHSSSWDAQATFLHEAVGHHGLRELFGEHFDTFLDNVYNNAEEEIKAQIDKKAQDKGWKVKKATEEYLSELAEDQEILQSDRLSGFFNSVKKFFFDMLAKIGFNPGFKLSNNELKYILWRSYQNLAEPGRYRSVVDQAKDVAMQYGLKVGNYEEKTPMANVAEEPGNDDIRYREKEDKKKLNNAEYIRLTEAYNNAKTLDEKAEAAELIIRGIERVIGDDLSYIAKTHEEFIRVIPSLTEEEKSSIRAGEVQGMFDGTMTHLDVEAIENSDELINTWFHENGHRIVDQFNLFTKSELESLYDELNQSSVKDFLNHYKLKPKYEQAEEIINAGVEWIVVNNSLENIVNNDINYDFIPKQLRKFVETIFNTLQNEQLQKDQRREGGIREAGLSSSAGENNRGSGKNTGREDQEASTGDRGGIRFKRRSLENDIRSAEGNPGEKLNTLFDNSDNLSKVVPNYPDFLNRVLQNSPKKQEIFRDARERGWNNLDKAIESYMASVEDADELGRIRDMLEVEVPDNALRYLLWRNANPNDGSPRWIAEEALKRKEFDGNAIFQKGKAPTKSAENEYEKRVRSRYNKGFRSLMFGIEEGWFDRMASLRILQNAITGNKAVPDKANAYMLENQLSSRNTSDIRYYNKNLIDPVIEQLKKVFGRDKVAADNYLNAKHGLERNVRMARQEADRWKENAMFELMKKELDDAEHEQAVRDIEELTEKKYNDNLKKDYSGLTALANEYDRKDFEEFANELVSEVENRIGKEEVDKLWNDINKATKWILDKQYNSGLMTKENYENIRNMYEYYVPLRGFAELTATDLYEYLQNPPSDFNGVLKTARGRTSKAESPVLSIMNMGESGIMQANRNRMKQAFYRLVATNPSNYASIEDVWLVKSGNDWQERFPEINPNASGDEVADAIAEFNNEMAELAAKGEAVQGKNKLNVGVKILPAQASEHAVRVWIGGQEKVIYINGNPRAAQAINGLTQNNLIPRGAARRSVEFWSRQMAANFTSRNPAFMITNFMRDVQFALISATVKEGGRYSAQLASNVTKVGKTIALNVWGKENTGNAEFQKYWDEFVANGGETGYANLHSIDQHRKYVNKKLREFSDQRDFLKPFREYTKFMENGNRMIEDMSRFATYVTSRQSGRSIERSVSDAKEITINFNRKGSGGFLANFVHSFYLFANPALQSMRLLGMMAKNHPVRFTAMLSSSMAMGALVPFMNELLINLFGDDDDKDVYWNMAEWTRRNNLVLYMPGTKDKFVTLMLPHELRAFYGIGEIGYSYMNGRLRHQNILSEIKKQLTAMMPIDPFGGHDWWVPDVGKPLYQAHHKVNKNFMDRPIYKDTPWNKLDPEWTKAYKSTPSVLVEAAKWINEQSGGDEVVGGKVNLNPARAYHIFSGYMGGFLTTYTDLANVGFNLLTGRDVSLNDVPVGNKLIRTSDEKTAEMKLNSEYFYYLDWMREYEHAQSGYKKRVQEKDYRDKYIKLRRSNEGSIYRYAKKMRDAIDKLQGVNEEKAMELKKEFVEKMWEYEGG